jgi:hypothetical protein
MRCLNLNLVIRSRAAVLLPCVFSMLGAAPALAFDPTEPDPGTAGRSTPELAPEVVAVPSGFPRLRAGLDLVGAAPQGEFSRYVSAGWGITGYLSQGFGEEGLLGIRLDAGFLNYGNETVPLSLGRVWYDVNTSNNIVFATFGPQVEVGGSDMRLYGQAFAGLSYFVTTSNIEGWEDAPSTTNWDDVVPAYGVGGGVQIKVKNGLQPALLNLAVRYQMHPNTSYLTQGDVVDGPDATYLFPVESETNILMFQVGIAFGSF